MKNIRKIFCVFLALLTLCGSFVTVNAAPGTDLTLTVSADKTSVSQGNTVTFTLLVTDIKSAGGLVSLDVPFNFDANVFDYVGATPIYPEEWAYPDNFSYSTAEDGFIMLRILNNPISADTDPADEKGCVADGKMGFKVTLRAKKDCALGSTTVTTNGDGVFKEVSGTTVKDGKYVAVFGKGLSGSVSVTEFTGVRGDVNQDTKVNSLDAAMVLRYDAGLIKLEGKGAEMADVNGDGKVNSLDAAMILRYDAGLILGF